MYVLSLLMLLFLKKQSCLVDGKTLKVAILHLLSLIINLNVACMMHDVIVWHFMHA